MWAADIKQIKTGEGWLYLGAVQDLFSRRTVGWAMAPHMRQELVVDALKMAVAARRPPKGTIHHSDHDGQYISLALGQAAHDAGIAQSMGEPSRLWRRLRSRISVLERGTPCHAPTDEVPS